MLWTEGWSSGTIQRGKRTKSSHNNTVWVHNNVDSKRIRADSIDDYICMGYKIGRGPLKPYKTNNDKTNVATKVQDDGSCSV